MIAPDVNIIFSVIDASNREHTRTKIFLKRNNRRKFVVLSKVSAHFQTTYARYIEDVGSIVITAVKSYKQNRKATFSLTPKSINQILMPIIDKELCKLANETSYSLGSLQHFKDLLLGNFSLPHLYNEGISEFRENSIERALDISISKLNEFCAHITRLDFMKLSMYTTFEYFLAQLTLSDYEDRIVYAECCAYRQEHGAISLWTYDNAFKRFIKSNSNKFGVGLV